jgi:hypothetical protein
VKRAASSRKAKEEKAKPALIFYLTITLHKIDIDIKKFCLIAKNGIC